MIIITQILVPKLKDKIPKNVAKACKKSAIRITFFLSQISARTPARGITIRFGRNVIVAATDKSMALWLSIVIHQIIEKNTTEDPSIEKICPDKNIKYFFNEYLSTFSVTDILLTVLKIRINYLNGTIFYGKHDILTGITKKKTLNGFKFVS